MNFRTFRKGRKRGGFNPNREYCEVSVAEYLKDGGKVTLLKVDGPAHMGKISRGIIEDGFDDLNTEIY